MTIISRCPDCGKFRSLATDACGCGRDLKSARQSGRVRYYAKIMVNGVRRRFPLGNRLSKARKEHARLLTEYNDTGHVKSRLTMTVGEYYKKFFLPEQKRKNKSWDKVKLRYDNHLRPVLGHMRLMAVEGHHIQAYINRRLETKNRHDKFPQPATVNRELAVLKRLFNQARGDGLFVGENPVFGKMAGPEKKKLRHRFDQGPGCGDNRRSTRNQCWPADRISIGDRFTVQQRGPAEMDRPGPGQCPDPSH